MIHALHASFPNPVLNDIKTFLNDESAKYQQVDKSKSAILIVGNTGSGKTSLAHFIAGDLGKLISVPTSDDPDQTDYLIEDLNDKISKGSSTTVSKTITPELMIDEENYVWYDCPGFSDTRNSSIELITTYSLKSLTDKIENIKFLFVVNHASVSKGYDRLDFKKMVEHGVKLINNIERFDASIALAVSKVQAFKVSRKKIIQIPEEVIVNTVAEFISEYKSELEKTNGTERHQMFVNALLQKSDHGEYTHIGVFWRPDEPGTFDQLELMVDARVSLRSMVIERTKYTQVSHGDFGYPLSEKSEMVLMELSKDMNLDVLNSIEFVAFEIKRFFTEKQHDSSTLIDRRMLFNKTNSLISELLKKIDKMDSDEILENLMNITREMELYNVNKRLDDIFEHKRYLEFFQTISSHAIELTSIHWLPILRESLDLIQIENNWNEFLIELFNILSSYNVQKDRSIYNVANISDWGKPNKEQGIFINSENFLQFLEHQKGYYNLFRDLSVTEQKLKDLNGVLDITLKRKIEIFCDGDKMTVKGEFLKSSDINIFACGTELKRIDLFAINTFFADCVVQFNRNGGQLSIIAYKWEIVKNVTFNLDGFDDSHEPESPFVATKQHSAGIAGKPGSPGGNGAHFFGLATEFASETGTLTISSNGGKGGRGQNGSSAYHYHLTTPGYVPYKKYGLCSYFKRLRNYKDCTQIDFDKKISREVIPIILTDEDTRDIYSFEVRGECCSSDGLAGAGIFLFNLFWVVITL